MAWIAVAVMVLALGCDLSTSDAAGSGGSLRVEGVNVSQGGVTSGDPIVSYDGAFEVYAAIDPWDGGACVDAWIRNIGPDLDSWRVTLELDKEVTSVSHSAATGYLVFVYAREIVIVPERQTKLRSGDVVQLRYCAEPAAIPVDVIVSEAGAFPGSPDGTAPGFGYAALSRGNFLLYSQPGAEWEGGACLQLRVKNNGPDDVRKWSAQFRLSAAAEKLQDPWGAYLQLHSSRLVDVDPLSGAEPFRSGDSVAFGFCATPAVEISELTAFTFEVVPPEDVVDPGTDVVEPGEVVDPDEYVPFWAGTLEDFIGKALFEYSTPYEVTPGVRCMDVGFRNTGQDDLAPAAFVVDVASAFELGNFAWVGSAEVTQPSSSSLSFAWPAGQILAPGQQAKGTVCMSPPRKPFSFHVATSGD